jgi:hypothetical protein
VNWGGAAIDPGTGILYANTNRIASIIRLVPRRVAKYEHIERVLTALTRPYLPRKKFWLSVFILVLLVSLARRRRVNPGVGTDRRRNRWGLRNASRRT